MSKKYELEKEIYQILKQHIVPITVEELMSKTGVREQSVRVTLGKMVKEKTASRAGGGKFTAKKQNERGK